MIEEPQEIAGTTTVQLVPADAALLEEWRNGLCLFEGNQGYDSVDADIFYPTRLHLASHMEFVRVQIQP